MKKQILTLSILSSVLNLNTSLAHERGIYKQSSGTNVHDDFRGGTDGGGGFWFPELENSELQWRIIHVVKAVISASQFHDDGTILEKAP